MSKMTMCGDALVVTSELSLEDIEKLERYNPKALTLTDEDGKNVVFKVGTTDGDGQIGKYGMSFGSASHDGANKATITMLVDADACAGEDDIKEFVQDAVGMAIVNLDAVEVQAIEALKTVDANITKVLDHLTIA